jgi:hypothetical protein
MALVNWYPAGAPAWPPPGYSRLEFSSLATLEAWARRAIADGIADIDNPTNPERTAMITPARCNLGHTVTARMLVIGGLRYPFARCDDAIHREFLVPWAPYFWGS